LIPSDSRQPDPVGKPEVSPQTIIIACLIVGAILLAFWVGYNIGLGIGGNLFK
jgi:hypothetical protein